MIAEGSGCSPQFQAAWRTINFSSLCQAAVKPISSGSRSKPLFTLLNVLEASSSAHDFVFLVNSKPVFLQEYYLLVHEHLKTAQLWRSIYDSCNWRCTLPSRCIILIAISCMWLTSCLSTDEAHQGTWIGGNVEPWKASF